MFQQEESKQQQITEMIDSTDSSLAHTKLKNNTYNCSFCDKNFSSKWNLKEHIQIHTNEKPFTCEDCKKLFSRKRELKKHMMMYDTLSPVICEICKLSFTRKCALITHMKTHSNRKLHIHNRPQFNCNECKETFSNENKLNRHLKVHQNLQYTCDQCKKKFSNKLNLNQHLRTHHTKKCLVPVSSEMPLPIVEFKRIKHQISAFGVFKTLTFHPEKNEEGCLVTFQTNLKPELQYNLQSEIREKKAIKWFMISKILFERERGEGDIETITSYFRSDCYIDLAENSIINHIDEGYSKINQSFEEFNSQGSDWTLRKIQCLELNISKYSPLSRN